MFLELNRSVSMLATDEKDLFFNNKEAYMAKK